MQMTGNTILITGGTSGIGLGLAQHLHAEGNTVIIAGRRGELLASITAEHAGMDSVVLDVTDPDSVPHCFTTVTAKYPDLNVLINNAGIMLAQDLTDPAHLGVAEETVATNQLGPIRVLTQFVPFLTAQPAAVIMNVSSGPAFVPLPLTPTYSATTAAIHSFTQSLRVQLAGTGVQVLELIPPGVQTTLMGQTEDELAMPLPAFLDEVMTILRTRPDAVEIAVQRVAFLRNAEAEGRHDDVLTMLSGPH